eukprot:261980-Pelagomonas_calceolata.AAC.6
MGTTEYSNTRHAPMKLSFGGHRGQGSRGPPKPPNRSRPQADPARPPTDPMSFAIMPAIRL